MMIKPRRPENGSVSSVCAPCQPFDRLFVLLSPLSERSFAPNSLILHLITLNRSKKTVAEHQRVLAENHSTSKRKANSPGQLATLSTHCPSSHLALPSHSSTGADKSRRKGKRTIRETAHGETNTIPCTLRGCCRGGCLGRSRRG